MNPTLRGAKYDYAFVADAFFNADGKQFRGGAELHLRRVVEVVRACGKSAVVFQQGAQDERFTLDDGTMVVSLAKRGQAYTQASYRAAASAAARIHYNQVLRIPAFANVARYHISATFHGTDWDVPDLKNIGPEYFTGLTRTRVTQHGYRVVGAVKQYRALAKGIRFLSVDSSLLRFAQQFIPKASRAISYIPNFVDTQCFRPDGPKAHLHPDVQSRRIILFPRNFSIARGMPLLPRFLAILINAGINPHLLICGQKVDKVVNPVERAFNKEILRYGFGDRITFLGSLDPDELSCYYRRADLTIVPSLFSEGTSLSALEAMACGSPILTSNIGGLLDIVTDGWDGRVVPATSEDLAQAAFDMLTSREETVRQAELASRKVLNSYNYETWSRRVRQFFENAPRPTL